LVWSIPEAAPLSNEPPILIKDLDPIILRVGDIDVRAVAGEDLVPGLIAVIQTFGDRINLHPHLHYIRPLLSLERLPFEEKEGKVSYRYGKEAEEVERMDYTELCRSEAALASDRPSGIIDGRRGRQ